MFTVLLRIFWLLKEPIEIIEFGQRKNLKFKLKLRKYQCTKYLKMIRK